MHSWFWKVIQYAVIALWYSSNLNSLILFFSSCRFRPLSDTPAWFAVRMHLQTLPVGKSFISWLPTHWDSLRLCSRHNGKCFSAPTPLFTALNTTINRKDKNWKSFFSLLAFSKCWTEWVSAFCCSPGSSYFQKKNQKETLSENWSAKVWNA